MWLGSDGNLYAPGESVPEVVTTLTAQWTVNQYTITYNLAGGTVEGNPDTYTIETVAFTLRILPNPAIPSPAGAARGLTAR